MRASIRAYDRALMTGTGLQPLSLKVRAGLHCKALHKMPFRSTLSVQSAFRPNFKSMPVQGQHTSKTCCQFRHLLQCLVCLATTVLRELWPQVISLLKVQAHLYIKQRCARLDADLRHRPRSVSVKRLCWSGHLQVQTIVHARADQCVESHSATQRHCPLLSSNNAC